MNKYIDSAETKILDIRDQVIDITLVVAALLGGIPVATSLSRALSTGWRPALYGDLIVYAVLIVVTLARKRLSFRILATFTLGILTVIGMNALLSWGPASGGILFLLTATVLTTVMFGTRAGVWAVLATVSLVGLVGVGVMNGWVTYDFDMQAHVNSWSFWISKVVALGFFLGVLVLGVGSTHRRLINTIKDLNSRTLEQRETYEKLKAEIADRRQAEDQLRQAQKMEAVGQLAGGVAHDFNNLLFAIRGYTGLAAATLPADSVVRTHLAEVTKASDRASILVRQLLTFSRREPVRPRTLDLREVINDLMKMIRRVIGEHLDLNVTHGSSVNCVNADPGQIEQVLVNLCVNARDAMREGGSITIETRNVTLDEEFAEQNAWAHAGEYVLLSVSDTGAGMSPEVMERIFEPFFTTKEVGEGTGLGLATVYGILKRQDGLIHVESEEGKGSTFNLYFPADSRELEAAPQGEEDAEVRSGSGTILLAEDDELVRNLAVEILRGAGYRLIVAQDGEEAVQLFTDHSADISFLLLDVIMPRMNGRAAYEKMKEIRDDVPVLFMSGYSYDALRNDTRLDDGFELLEKPFGSATLLRTIRQMMETAKS
ncbi:MAG: response regulator [Candidatus Hydrogenedentes bacterium]|nr:response regulator [Candidatus Hydrogenedentota bacterium]